MAARFIPTPAELDAAATRRRDLPVGFVEIGIGHAVRLTDIFDVHETAGVTSCTVQLHGSYFDRTTFSPLTYHALLERIRQAQRDELAEPGDPEVVHLLREALDQLPEDRRQWLDRQVQQILREAHGAITIPPNVTLTRDEVVGSSTSPADTPDWAAGG